MGTGPRLAAAGKHICAGRGWGRGGGGQRLERITAKEQLTCLSNEIPWCSNLQSKGTYPVLQLSRDGQMRASFCPKQTPGIHSVCHILSPQRRVARLLARGFSCGAFLPPLLPPASSQAQPAPPHKGFSMPLVSAIK